MYVCMYVGVRPGIQSEDQNQFFTFKVRTFWQSEVKISVLALWLSSLFHNMGVGGVWTLSSLCTCQTYSEVCEKKCPHFECVIHKFVLVLKAGTNTLYTHVYIVSSLWMPGQVGGCGCVCVWSSLVSFSLGGYHFLWKREVINTQKYPGNIFATPLSAREISWTPPIQELIFLCPLPFEK